MPVLFCTHYDASGDETLLQETPIGISNFDAETCPADAAAAPTGAPTTRTLRRGVEAAATGSWFAPDSHQLIHVVIADGRPIFRDGLRRLLQTEPCLRIVGETGPGFDAATLVRNLRADILLVDFAPQTTFETLKTLAESGEAVRTIILAEYVDGGDLTKALELGARGLVLRDSAADVLFKSIHSVLAGQYWIASDSVVDAPSGLRKLEAELRRRRVFGLTPRELEIVGMVVGAFTNKEIGEKLAIGENTVKSHLTHIFNKVGASSRIELALFAAHHRLLDSV